eukprot:scaffold252404_cov16-Prasinocladus_malaysianus.AAC.2
MSHSAMKKYLPGSLRGRGSGYGARSAWWPAALHRARRRRRRPARVGGGGTCRSLRWPSLRWGRRPPRIPPAAQHRLQLISYEAQLSTHEA